MCGITGIIDWRREEVDAQVLQRMTDRVKHRGPDDSKIWVQGAAGLGHARLSIIDLSAAGAQPMATPDGRYRLVFNGEIYNYSALREKYCRGIVFKSTSDTEVLLNLLIRQGPNILSELKGMFALALWDQEKQEVMLARDAFGKKPLYYWQDKNILLFASEIKALAEHPMVKLTMSKKAVISYLIYEYVPEPETGWEGVWQLPMGCWAKVSARGMKITQWWKACFEPKTVIAEKDAAEKFDHLMRQSVQRRLVADVPVGLLLSGGIDSTAVGWYMKSINTTELHSFSIGFEENMFNEAGYAQQAASVLGTRHHHRDFGIAEFKYYCDRLEQMDVPLGDSSLLPTLAVCDMASKELPVVLDGDGSDELLGGYGVFEAAAWAEKLPSLPRSWWQIGENISKTLPTGYDYFTWDFKIKSFLRGLGWPRPQRQQAWLGSFSGEELKSLLTEEYWELAQEAWRAVIGRAEGFSSLHWWDAMSAQIVKDYLQNDILVKLDRASMAYGLEARTPFLDVDLAEFIMQLPIELKKDKRLLRRIMRGRIPDSIIDRRKQGFAMPLGHWLRGELNGWTTDLLVKQDQAGAAMFKPKVVENLLAMHQRGRADNRKKLWTLIALKLWQKQIK